MQNISGTQGFDEKKSAGVSVGVRSYAFTNVPSNSKQIKRLEESMTFSLYRKFAS